MQCEWGHDEPIRKMDLIAILAPDFGFNWGKNGGFWI